jgi:hypothetical protein
MQSQGDVSLINLMSDKYTSYIPKVQPASIQLKGKMTLILKELKTIDLVNPT